MHSLYVDLDGELPDTHGWLTFAGGIQYSSNIGATKVGERLRNALLAQVSHGSA